MMLIDLFAGIGGFSLAAHWMGWETALFCEKEKFPQAVLAKNFPGIPIHDDIRTLTKKKIYELSPEIHSAYTILTGGFPCQPYSTAGARKGNSDDRALWPEMLRVIREIQPAWIVGENVAGIVSMDNGRTLEGILSDLEREGYRAQVFLIPACSVQAIHRRDRVWIIAHRESECSNVGEFKKPSRKKIRRKTGTGDCLTPNTFGPPNEGVHTRRSEEIGLHMESNPLHKKRRKEGTDGSCSHSFEGNVADTHTKGLEKRKSKRRNTKQKRQATERGGYTQLKWPTEPPICRTDDGHPGWMDGSILTPNKHRQERLKALGNAIVPHVAYEIFKAIDKIHNQH